MDSEKKARYISRELSLVSYHTRILGKAKDPKIPLMERLSFLMIASSNMDEFYKTRVAKLKDKVSHGILKKDLCGLTPYSQLTKVQDAAALFYKTRNVIYRRSLLPVLGKYHFRILRHLKELDDAQIAFLKSLWNEKYAASFVFDEAMTDEMLFPEDKRLYAAVLMEKEETVSIRIMPCPENDHLIPLPGEGHDYIFYTDFLNEMIRSAHPAVVSAAFFRVLRSADFSDEETGESMEEDARRLLEARKESRIVRADIQMPADKRIITFIEKSYDLSADAVLKVNGPLDFGCLNRICRDCKDLTLFYPDIPVHYQDFGKETLMSKMEKEDVMLFHPYDDYGTVIRLLQEAAQDPLVLVIRQVLYRVSADSPVISWLEKAAENGKQVYVILELRAKFDEAANLANAERLMAAGVHVIYGMRDYKVHSKLTLIIRRDGDLAKYYAHLGTGNYNEKTASIYTDLSLLTCDPVICEDVAGFFNMVMTDCPEWIFKELLVSPCHMRDHFLELIENEKKNALEGRKAEIIIKVNGLSDRQMIDALYDAGAAGVKIRLIVRGVCCLIPQAEDLSENIDVVSITGRFLEHSRLFAFYNGGEMLLYAGSADLMKRNLDKRAEVIYPVKDPEIRERLLKVLKRQLKDNIGAMQMTCDGTYIKKERRGKKTVDSQKDPGWISCSI